MSSASERKKAIAAIQQKHILLVYPIKNKKEPESLWSSLFPRSEMVWEWDADADGRVSRLWLLREELSRSNEVIYAKWYQNRATFFSREIFVDLLAFLREGRRLPKESEKILGTLKMDSPLSTKQIKADSGLQGRWLESAYNRAMKELWQRLWIVAFGEVDDSSFPSLAVGATENIFEDLWTESLKRDPVKAGETLRKKLGEKNRFYQQALKIRKQLG